VNTSDVEKIKSVHEQNIHVEANNNKQIVMLDKEKSNQRIKLNSKYVSLTRKLVLNVLMLMFIGFNSCKERFEITFIITTIIVQAVASKDRLFLLYRAKSLSSS